MDPRYPIGTFEYHAPLSSEQRTTCKDHIAQTPEWLRAAVQDLTPAQLDTPYRDGGWTVRQVVHHLADSHVNAYVRMKLALTEEKPTIKTYDQQRWAETPDVSNTPVEVSLTFIEALHARWMRLWEALQDEDFQRAFLHPDHGERTLDWMLALYAWHGRHHVAHITELRKREGW